MPRTAEPDRSRPTWFDTAEQLDAAVADVAALSPACRGVLGSLIETQGKSVETLSSCLGKLESLGFAFMRGDPWTRTEVTPTLWGEEAYGTWDDRRVAKTKKTKESDHG